MVEVTEYVRTTKGGMNYSHQARLEVIDELPRGFLDATRDTLHKVLAGPTLIHLPGKRPEPGSQKSSSICFHENRMT